MDHDFDNRPESEEGVTTPHLTLDQLTAYLDGDLAPEERVRFDDHLRTCRDCRRELTELRSTVALLNGLPDYRPRRSFQLAPERIAATRPWWERLGFRLLPALPALRAATVAAAILLVSVSAGEIVRDRTGNHPAPPEAAFVQPTVVATNQTLPAPPPTSTTRSLAPTVTPHQAAAAQAPKAPTPTIQAETIRPAPVTQTAAPQGNAGSGAGVAEPTSESTGNEAAVEAPSGGDTSGAQETSGTTVQSDTAAAPPAAAAAPAATETPTEGESDTAQVAMAAAPAEPTTTPGPASGGEGGRNAVANRAADESTAAKASPPAAPPAPSASPTPTEVPASSTPLPATPPPTAVPATPTPLPATPVTASQPAAENGGGVSGWRVAQIALAFLLLWLAVTVVGLQRLRGRR